MGECCYYLRAVFTKPNKKAIQKLWTEGWEAEDWWQDHRDNTPAQFWPEFQTKFPAVYKYLGSPAHTADNNNGLSGKLDFGNEELNWNGNILRYSAEVWHFADWSTLCEHLKTEFGAISASYITEEDGISVGDSLDQAATQRLIREGVEPPNYACKNLANQICGYFLEKYSTIPQRVGASVENGTLISYYNAANGREIEIEIYNDLSVAAVVSDSRTIFFHQDIVGLDFESCMKYFLE